MIHSSPNTKEPDQKNDRALLLDIISSPLSTPCLPKKQTDHFVVKNYLPGVCPPIRRCPKWRALAILEPYDRVCDSLLSLQPRQRSQPRQFISVYALP
jgi:hypothetical protein